MGENLYYIGLKYNNEIMTHKRKNKKEKRSALPPGTGLTLLGRPKYYYKAGLMLTIS